MNRRDFLRLSAATAAAIAVPTVAAKALAAAPALRSGELGVVEGVKIFPSPSARRITRWSLTARREAQEFFSMASRQSQFMPGMLTTEIEWEQIILPDDETLVVLPCPDDTISLEWFKNGGVPVPDYFPETKYVVTDVRFEVSVAPMIKARCRALELLTSKSAKT